MSDPEMDQWLNMVNQVFRLGKSQRVIVGVPGYGSHQEWEALYQFGMDTPVLKQVNLNPDGSRGGLFSTLFPVPIKNDDSIIGWTVLSISRVPQFPEPAVSFDHHGAHDLYWFNNKERFRKT